MTENISKFLKTVSADPVLAEKMQAITAESARLTAEKISALSAGGDTPFTAEEFLASVPQSSEELSEEQLAGVAGGVWAPTADNILMSIVSFGIGCAIHAAVSAAEKGSADACQPGKK